MKRSTILLFLLATVADCFWKEAKNLVPDVVKGVGETFKDVKDKVVEGVKDTADTLNPLQLLYVDRCVEELGCFFTGPPFHHIVNRPLSFPPTGNPKVRFHLFTPSNPDEAYAQEITQESLENSTFDPSLETKFLIHGFMSDLDFDDVRFEIKDAFLRIGRFNIFIVDWTEHNGFPYAQAAANTRVVGALVAKLVHLLMNETGITPQSVHIIGHSLGAHTAGYAGERIPNLGRITGLDPAGPYFQDCEPEVRLDSSDALFVDVIHTDGAEFILGGLGINDPIGHMDFYPNGGSRQLGCVYSSKQDNVMGAAVNFTTKWIQNGCDHGRSNAYFLESIENSKCRFLAVHCSSYSNYEQGQCPPRNSTVAEMGYHVKRTSLQPPARFYLRTNGEKPFCHQESVRLL